MVLPSYAPALWTAVAIALWGMLGAAGVLGAVGLLRRRAAPLLVGGALALVFCWMGMLSLGLFVLIVPLLEFAAGIGLLLRRRRAMPLLFGWAVALYAGALLAVLGRI